MSDDYTPVSCQPYSYICSAAVTAQQLVEITGDRTVGPAAVTSEKVVGVAAFSQVQNGQVTVHPIGLVHETKVASGQSLTAGNAVKAGALGTVQAYTAGTDADTARLGTCIVGASAGNLARWVGI